MILPESIGHIFELRSATAAFSHGYLPLPLESDLPFTRLYRDRARAMVGPLLHSLWLMGDIWCGRHWTRNSRPIVGSS